MKAVEVIDDPGVAELLIDPMRRTIFSILADGAKTETQLAEVLGLTESAVGHHLRALEDAGLVRLVKKEPEVHGILQKFYRSCALSFVIDSKKMPHEVSRYFFPVNIERIRGALSVLQISAKFHLSSAAVEAMSDSLAKSLVEVAKGHAGSDVSMDRESFTVKLYSEALLRMLHRKEKLFQPFQEVLTQLISVKIR